MFPSRKGGKRRREWEKERLREEVEGVRLCFHLLKNLFDSVSCYTQISHIIPQFLIFLFLAVCCRPMEARKVCHLLRKSIHLIPAGLSPLSTLSLPPPITHSLNLPPDCYSPSLHTHHYVSLVALPSFSPPPHFAPSSSSTSSFPGPRAPRKSHVFPKWTGWEIEAGLLCLSSHSSVTLLLLPSGGPGKLVTAATTLQHTCPLFFFPPVCTSTHSTAPRPV